MGSENGKYAIDLHFVDKVYKGKIHALRGIEMKVHHGEIFGLLGPNGAGKSTLVKIMMTVVRPTKAKGTMLGHPIGHKATLARVGYLPEHHRFPNYLTGKQTLEFFAALANVDRRTRKKQSAALLDLVGMSEWGNKKISTYSKGMMQRVGIAQALMNDPDLIVLDEPTDGVDPVGRRDIRDVLLQMKERGKTVFINSHLLSELEMVCDRVAILVQGKVSTQGTIDDLTADSQRYEIVIDGKEPAWVSEIDDLRAEARPSDQTVLILRSTDADRVQPIIDRLRSSQTIIHSIKPVRESLEDLFMRAVTDPVTGKAFQPGAAVKKSRKSQAGEGS